MTLPRSTTVGAIALAFAWTALSFGATLTASPAEARDNGIYYRAELVQPASKAKTVAGGVLWMCEGTNCVAGRGKSRPLRMCRELQREVGDIASFSVDGAALDQENLASCND